MNQIIQSLYERKSVRVYEDRPIPETIKQEILEAATQAPTAGCQQLYTILDITEEDFKDIQYKSLEIDGKIATVIFDKNSREQKEKLNALLPMAIDEYKLTMEEVFLNEMEEKKYDITKIFEK